MATPTPTILIRPRGIDGGIRFWWTASDPGLVDSYVLSCASPSLSYPIASVSTNYYEVTGLTNLTPYTFQLVAYKDAVASEPAVFRTIQPGLKPPAPTSAVAYSGNNSATIEWTPNSILPEPTKTQPTVWYVVKAESSTDIVVHRIGQYDYLSTATLLNLNPAHTYAFRVYAINDAGYSPGTLTNTITPTNFPAVASRVVAYAGPAQITVSWFGPTGRSPPDDGGLATTYTIKYSSDGTNYTSFGTTFSKQTGTVTGLTNGTSYTFKVSGTNANGTSADSAATTALAPANNTMVWNEGAAGGDVVIANGGRDLQWQFGYSFSALGTTLVETGQKVMYSIEITQAPPTASVTIGWGTLSFHFNGIANAYDGYPGNDTQSVGIHGIGTFVYNGTVQQSGLPTYGTVGDIVDIALHDGVGWWMRVNEGLWNNDALADPASDTGGLSIEGLTGLYPAANPGGSGLPYGILHLVERNASVLPSGYTFLYTLDASP